MNNQLRKLWKEAVLTSLEARSEGPLQKADKPRKS